MNAELRKQLEQLHGELAKTQSVDPESRALLVALLTDISRLLEPAEPGAPAEHSLVERLDELAVQFDAEYPALSIAIRRVVDTLAKAGI